MKKKTIIILGIVGAVIVVLGAVGLNLYNTAYNPYEGSGDVRIYIPEGADLAAVDSELRAKLGDDFGGDVARILGWRDAEAARMTGSYVIKPGDRAWSVANRLRTGTQAPVTLTFNNLRTLSQLADSVSRRFSWDAQAFMDATRKVLPQMGYADSLQYPAAFLPDTYQFYWNTPAEQVVRKLAEHTASFWNGERQGRAKALGLTPVQVTTLASIVEEETNRANERPLVARLYLNRLQQGMRLQADPTVKFAVGDFTIQRIGGAMLKTDSPYNTYAVTGTPPGPIRIAEGTTIDAVLNAPVHEYIYMCARPDGSGYHNFTADFAKHQENARQFQKYLDTRGVNLDK